METIIGALIGGLAVIAYMLFRSTREMAIESLNSRKEARAAQAQVEKLENELEQQKAIATSTKVTTFPSNSDKALKAKNTQLRGEYDLLKNEQLLIVESLSKIHDEVNKPENMSRPLAIKIRAHLFNIVGSMAN